MTRLTKNYDIAIIGAGILGISLAYHLRNSGKKIVLIERESLPAVHASGKNAGMLRHLYRHPQLTEWALRTSTAIQNSAFVSCFQKTGSVIVGRSLPEHHQTLFKAEIVSHKSSDSTAVRCEEDGLLDSSQFVQLLFRASKNSKIDFLFSQIVTKIEQKKSEWKIQLNSGEQLCSSIVVNASGAWFNSALYSNPHLIVDMQPFARHLFLVGGWPVTFMPSPHCGFYWDEISNWYMRCWDQTTRLVSICDETACTPDSYVAPTNLDQIVAEKLLANLPLAVANQLYPIRSWHCFRTYTPDQLPLWGWDPLAEGLFSLGAFGGFGMSTGYAAAQDAAAAVLGKNVSVSAELYPQRAHQLTLREVI